MLKWRLLFLGLVALAWVSTATSAEADPTPSPTATPSGIAIRGTVVDLSNGLPVLGATVTLLVNERRASQTRTDGRGAYSFFGEPPGSYSIEVAAPGYATTRSAAIFVGLGQADLILSTTMSRSKIGGSGLRTIGSVSVSDRQSMQTTTVIHSDLEAPLLQNEDIVRVGDALNTLPGVNLDSQSSAVGDDISADVRGIGATETSVLLDGHPIGPIGVAPGTFYNNMATAFNFSDTPTYALSSARAVYGTGALGLYGTDAIGGIIDLRTLNPTPQNYVTVRQGGGNNGQQTTAVQATGTEGRLGYALVSSVQGTYGNFPSQVIEQSGLLGTNFSAANAAANTYTVSANYDLRNDLFKVIYNLSEVTQLELTGYVALSYDDKSGNGDNDFRTYAAQLYFGQQAVKAGGTTITNPNLPVVVWSCQPGTVGLNGNPTHPGIAVTTRNGSYACYSPAQFASASSGPAGGGPGPFQDIRNQDYHARVTTKLGKSDLVLDGYADNYALDYNRNAAGGPCDQNPTCSQLFPNATFATGGFNTNFTRTKGLLVSDDIATEKNDFGLGYFALQQTIDSDIYNTQTFVLQPQPALRFTESNYFLRDRYSPNSFFAVYFNGWLKHTTLTNETKFDPRISVVLKPSPRDVIRFSEGTSTSAPIPSVALGQTVLDTTPQNIVPNCSGITSVGSAGNPHVASETGTGQEFSYGHNFRGDEFLQLNLYNENVFGKLFTANFPLSGLPGAIPPNLLAQYVLRVQELCPNLSSLPPSQVLAYLALSQPFNASDGRFRGIELTGRFRFNPYLYVDLSYDVQSAVLLGIPDSVLVANPTLVPGSQISVSSTTFGVPLHKASVGVALTNRRGFEARLDSYYIGFPNGYNRQPYTFSNFTASQALDRTLTLTFGAFNVFNSASDIYGRQYEGPFNAENQFGTDKNAIQQGSERFALPPTQFQFFVTERLPF
jgi:hypothetical protein